MSQWGHDIIPELSQTLLPLESTPLSDKLPVWKMPFSWLEMTITGGNSPGGSSRQSVSFSSFFCTCIKRNSTPRPLGSGVSPSGISGFPRLLERPAHHREDSHLRAMCWAGHPPHSLKLGKSLLLLGLPPHSCSQDRRQPSPKHQILHHSPARMGGKKTSLPVVLCSASTPMGARKIKTQGVYTRECTPYMYTCTLSVTKLCPPLCNHVDSRPPGSLSMGFLRQEYCSGLPFPSPGDLPGPRDQTHVSYISCIDRQVFTTIPLGKPMYIPTASDKLQCSHLPMPSTSICATVKWA